MKKWWPALDGLRGTAVIAVVIYHLDERLLPGGFLGVSMFFSISGFLIVGQLTAERDATGRIDLMRFWSRRARRLGPALLVTLFGTTIVVWATDPESLHRIAIDATAGLGYFANWHDMTAPVAYAERFGTVIEPLGHIWSLSIEEQMYLVAPLLVAWVGIRRSGWLAAAIVGFGFAMWWGSSDAYLATPVRLVEVMAGAWLGVRVHRGRSTPKWLVGLAAPAGIAALAALVVVSDTDRAVFTWLLPAISLIWVAMLAGATASGGFARVMANPVLRWVGERSYGIYLIHVPLIELTDWSPVTVALATLLLAELSHRVIEMPVRRGSVSLRLVGGGAVAVFGTVLGLSLVQYQQPDVAAALEHVMADSTAVMADSTAVPASSATATGDASTVFARRSSSADSTVPRTTTPHVVVALPYAPRILVVGDSVARSLEPALKAFAESRGGAMSPGSVPGYSPLFDETEQWNVRFDPGRHGFVPAGYYRPSVGSLIDSDGPMDVVVMIDHGMSLADHQAVDGSGAWMSILDGEVRDALTVRYDGWISQASERGAITVLATLADGHVDLPEGVPPIPDRSARVAEHNEMVRAVAASHPDMVILIDAAAAVEADPSRYERPDGVHFSEAGGAVALVADFFVPLFSSLQ